MDKDAVPIEFITKYLDSFRESRDSYHKGSDTYEYLDNVIGEIEAMVSEWEKTKTENK